MKIIAPRIHGSLDYLTVVAFLIAPPIFGFTGVPATISYLLAAVHLVVTLLTDFPLGALNLIPFPVHSAIELVAGLTLIILPFIAFASDPAARNFYVSAGIIFLIVWLLTDYKAASEIPTA